MNLRTYLLAIAFCIIPTWLHAATIHVDADGTGDYTTLQEGLDAAAEGDTVQVGPGRYDDFTVRTFSTGGTLQVIGYVTTPNIVLVGSSREECRIGPPEFVQRIDGISTACLGVEASATGVRIEDLTIENGQFGLGDIPGTTAERVSFSGTGQAAWQAVNTRGLTARDCSFQDGGLGLWFTTGYVKSDALIENSFFSGYSTAVVAGQVTNAIVRGCTFQDNGVSVQYWAGASGTIESCELRTPAIAHVDVVSGATVTMQDCTLEAGARYALVVDGSIATGTRCFFGGAQQETIGVYGGYAAFSHSTIERGAEYSLIAQSVFGQGFDFMDFRYNYWGTSDREQIEAWIFDGTDSQTPRVPVLFDPFLEDSVPTESLSVGGLKARYAPE